MREEPRQRRVQPLSIPNLANIVYQAEACIFARFIISAHIKIVLSDELIELFFQGFFYHVGSVVTVHKAGRRLR